MGITLVGSVDVRSVEGDRHSIAKLKIHLPPDDFIRASVASVIETVKTGTDVIIIGIGCTIDNCIVERSHICRSIDGFISIQKGSREVETVEILDRTIRTEPYHVPRTVTCGETQSAPHIQPLFFVIILAYDVKIQVILASSDNSAVEDKIVVVIATGVKLNTLKLPLSDQVIVNGGWGGRICMKIVVFRGGLKGEVGSIAYYCFEEGVGVWIWKQ